MTTKTKNLVHEYQHTWPRHGGHVVRASMILGMQPESLINALNRAKKFGLNVSYVNDIDWTYENERRKYGA